MNKFIFTLIFLCSFSIDAAEAGKVTSADDDMDRLTQQAGAMSLTDAETTLIPYNILNQIVHKGPKALSLLTEKKISSNAKDKFGTPILHYVITNNGDFCFELVKSLVLEYNADTTARNKDNQTPCELAKSFLVLCDQPENADLVPYPLERPAIIAATMRKIIKFLQNPSGYKD